MQTVQVRQSPSGPLVELDIPTTPADIGALPDVTGAISRMDLNVIPLEANIAIEDGLEHVLQDGVTDFNAELLLPVAARRYSAELDFDVTYYGGAGGDVALAAFIDSSVDAGASWQQAYYGQVTLSLVSGAAGSRHMSCKMKARTGTALGVVPATADLRLRARVLATGAPSGGLIAVQSLGTDGTLALQITEQI